VENLPSYPKRSSVEALHDLLNGKLVPPPPDFRVRMNDKMSQEMIEALTTTRYNVTNVLRQDPLTKPTEKKKSTVKASAKTRNKLLDPNYIPKSLREMNLQKVLFEELTTEIKRQGKLQRRALRKKKPMVTKTTSWTSGSLQMATANVDNCNKLERRQELDEEFFESSYDVIGVQETRISGEGHFFTNNYKWYYKGSDSTSEGAGVAILVKKELVHLVDENRIARRSERLMSLVMKDPQNESRPPLRIVSAYAPHAGLGNGAIESYYLHFEELLHLPYYGQKAERHYQWLRCKSIEEEKVRRAAEKAAGKTPSPAPDITKMSTYDQVIYSLYRQKSVEDANQPKSPSSKPKPPPVPSDSMEDSTRGRVRTWSGDSLGSITSAGGMLPPIQECDCQEVLKQGPPPGSEEVFSSKPSTKKPRAKSLRRTGEEPAGKSIVYVNECVHFS